MKHTLTLEYSIPTGDLSQYFDALNAGKALASACCACGHVAFPARVICPECKTKTFDWQPLTGTAQVLFRTDAGDASYALVQFDGADTCSTVALTNPENQTTTGTLIAPIAGQTGLWLALDDIQNGDKNER